MKKHHSFTHTHIEHHGDGSATVEHHHKDGAHKNVKHAAMNLDHVHDSLQDNLGMPNEGEDKDASNAPLAQAPPDLQSKIAPSQGV